LKASSHLDDAIRAISRKDAEWFKAHPHRSTRIRYAEMAEIAEAEILGNRNPLDAGVFPLHIIVHQVCPGGRIRILVALRKNLTGCAEGPARKIWEQFAKKFESNEAGFALRLPE
jgi:hypothetical protein